VTPREVLRVYQNREGSWFQLADGIAIEEETSYLSVSSSIVIGPDGIMLAVATLPVESTERGTSTVYSFLDPSGLSIPKRPSRNFPECDPGDTSFRFELTTDLQPSDQTWTLQKDGTGDPILSGGPFTEGLTTYMYETCLLSTDCYQLRVIDGFQEGLCCLYGEGGYVMFLDGKVAAMTSEMAYGVYSHWFGECKF